MIPHHPEIEDDGFVGNLLGNHEDQSAERTSVDVLEVRGDDIQWYNELDHRALAKCLHTLSLTQDAASTAQATQLALRVLFFDISPYRKALQRPKIIPDKDMIQTLQAAGFSNIILSEIYSPETMWAKMGDTCFLGRDENRKLSSFEIYYRYSCGWKVGASYIQLTRTRYLCTYFCVNYPPSAGRRLKKYLQKSPSLAYREFFLDTLAADESMKTWQTVIGDRRRMLINFERRQPSVNMDTATKDLHILSRDWHILHQDISDLSVQLRFLKNSYRKYIRTLEDDDTRRPIDAKSNTDESFEVLESRCNIYRRWITNYRDRTNIQINLLFHLATQAESRTNTQIAADTAKLAKQTQRDSTSMITIAAVTMLFLPGTFVSAILSTTFFEHQPDGLSVSTKWWILPATTLPLMVVVFGLWLGWQHIRIKDEEGLGWRGRRGFSNQFGLGARRARDVSSEGNEKGGGPTVEVREGVRTR